MRILLALLLAAPVAASAQGFTGFQQPVPAQAPVPSQPGIPQTMIPGTAVPGSDGARCRGPTARRAPQSSSSSPAAVRSSSAPAGRPGTSCRTARAAR